MKGPMPQANRLNFVTWLRWRRPYAIEKQIAVTSNGGPRSSG
jgi:hypothetical protein